VPSAGPTVLAAVLLAGVELDGVGCLVLLGIVDLPSLVQA